MKKLFHITIVLCCNAAALLATGHTVNITSTNALCSDSCNGTATAVVTGGTGPFAFLWSPAGGTGATATELCAGKYFCTVTDLSDLSTALDSVTITEPDPIQIYHTSYPAICGNGGSITIDSVTGGTPPFNFDWNLCSQLQPCPKNPTELTSGAYTVTVTDANGCAKSENVIVTAMSAPSVQLTPTHLICSGDSSGGLILSIYGGIAPYNYSWSNNFPLYKTNYSTGLKAGTYCITVTDANGCTSTSCATIYDAPSLSVTTSTTPEINGMDGTATATPAGGTGTLTITWSTGTVGYTVTKLTCGTYTVTVADANSCTASSVAVVNCMVGVQENNLPGLKITPNPASSSVTIERGIHTPCTIQLVNMLGETLYSTGEITTDRITIDMGLMPKGIYFVEVTDKLSNSRILGKVVLQ